MRLSLLCRNLPSKVGDVLTPEQYKEVRELGILVDEDDQVGAALGIGQGGLHERHT